MSTPTIAQRMIDPRYRLGEWVCEDASPTLKDNLGNQLGARSVFLDSTVTGTIVHNMLLDNQEGKNGCCMGLMRKHIKADPGIPIYFCWLKQKGWHKRYASEYESAVEFEDSYCMATLCSSTSDSNNRRLVVFLTLKQNRTPRNSK